MLLAPVCKGMKKFAKCKLNFEVFDFDVDVFVSFSDDDLFDVCFVDEFVVESVFALEDIAEWFAGVVEVGEGVGEAELVGDLVGRVGESAGRETQEHLHLVGFVGVGLVPSAFPCLVDGERFDVDVEFLDHCSSALMHRRVEPARSCPCMSPSFFPR